MQKKKKMLEDARAYNKEMLSNIDLIDPFSQSEKVWMLDMKAY